jgi:hypothetical protein
MAQSRLRRVSRDVRFRPLQRHWSGAICTLGRSSDISALSADIAQDEWQIAPQTFDGGYATSEPCLCASVAVTGEVTGNCSTVAR